MKEQNNTPLVTIRCLTYNQEPYIRQCLDGFVMQKTNFKYEAIVHDDASTDKTADIIREYAAKYPDIIKPIYETENQYSKGNNALVRIMMNHTRGKYVAFCEGDDYWTDENKLQRQVNFLENNSSYSLVAENAMVIYIKDQKHESEPFSKGLERDVLINELIQKRQFATASVVCRSEYFVQTIEELEYHYDTMFWCFLATKGKIKYFDFISSVYRRGAGVVCTTDRWEWLLITEKWNLALLNKFSMFINVNIIYKSILKSFAVSILYFLKSKRYLDVILSFYKIVIYTFKYLKKCY